jgi:hypothetical protein
MDLRDRFAVHFAAALVDVFPNADEIARRAYDLAEALLAERARRIDDEEARALAERRAPSLAAPPYHGALLDEPEPMLEPDPGWEEEPDPAWLEPPYDPSWDLDVHWSGEPTPSRPPGPGLARTQPVEVEEERKERSA